MSDSGFEKYTFKVGKFYGVAKAIAELSKDKGVKVGAIALDSNNNLISQGYNDFPRGVNDLPIERQSKPLKYDYTAHAEENLVSQAAYTGVSLKDSTVIVTSRFPCAPCARKLIQSGVKTVYAPRPIEGNSWFESNKIALEMFTEAGVTVLTDEALSSKYLDLDVE